MSTTKKYSRRHLCLTGSLKAAKAGHEFQYVLWLPTKLKHQTDQDETALGSTTMDDYQPFDELIHVTHLPDAASIFRSQKIAVQPPTSLTLANQDLVLSWSKGGEMVRLSQTKSPRLRGYRQLRGFRGIWLAPACSINTRYGSVAFNLRISGWEGIQRNDNYFNYYWVETIDYLTKSASRILVVPKESDPYVKTLKSLAFDPTVRGGPWYWDKQANKHYALKTSKSFEGSKLRDHTLEFLKSTDIVWPSEIPSWSAIPREEDSIGKCKRYQEKCTELNENLGIAKVTLCMWAHAYGASVAPGTSLGKRKRSDTNSYQQPPGGLIKRRLSASELENGVDEAEEYFFQRLYKAPRGEGCDINKVKVRWSTFVSCLKDLNFEGASEAISNVPYEFVYEEMRHVFPKMPETLPSLEDDSAAENEDSLR
ncbi:hypothetical protein BC832DRAFT_563356 [Gaertneriomyces semiglobifer]|nr:hypothetical protein BC832DRAFT_563356 [Gaertneriomyces semiglobifer]